MVGQFGLQSFARAHDRRWLSNFEQVSRSPCTGASHVALSAFRYAMCPAHPMCHCYTFIHQFEHPWQSVAHVLCHMRNGFGVGSAHEHKCAPPPSDVDIEAIKDELPAILLAFKSDDVLVR